MIDFEDLCLSMKQLRIESYLSKDEYVQSK